MFKVKRRRSNKAATIHREGSDVSSQQSSIQLRSCLRNGVGSEDASHRSYNSRASSQSDSLHNSTMSRSASTAKQRGVQFKFVQVREFERVIGDNPSCSSGAPISIGWAHSKDRVMGFEEYESARPPRRRQPELILTRQDREEILIEWGATFHEIIESIRANIRAKNQRRRTVNNLGTYDRWEEAMESASRKLKRTLLLKKPIRKQAEEMQAISERAGWKHVTYVHASHGPMHNDDVSARPPTMPVKIPEVTEPERNGSEELRSIGVDEYVTPQHQHAVQQPTMMEVGYENNQQEYVPDEASSWYLTSSIVSETPQPPSYGDIDFDRLVRHQAHWELEGMEPPGTRNTMVPVIISEDGYFDMYDLDQQMSDNGFTLQPPPYSNLLISKWE